MASTDDSYENPLQDSPRWLLSARAGALRSGAYIAYGLLNWTAPAATRVVWLDSTLGKGAGEKKKIRVDVYEPPQASSTAEAGSDRAARKLPAVINFHGGGFVLGTGTDDAFWAGAVTEQVGAVVFSVSYRLAPECPFPQGAEDCADAVLQIHARAREFGIDPGRTLLSGFSAGGTLALASWLILQDPSRWDYRLSSPTPPTCRGFVLFYPLLDWTASRGAKRQSCPRPDLTIPASLTDLFDASYVYPPISNQDRTDPRLSPGLMSKDMLDRLPPVHLVLCEYDMLQAEGHAFAARIRESGREVNVRVVEGEQHGWDKPPRLTLKPSAHVEYGTAIEAMKEWLGTRAQEMGD